MAKNAHTCARRGFLDAGAAIAACVSVQATSAAAATFTPSPEHPLRTELRAFDLRTHRMDREDCSEAEWEQWDRDSLALYAKIEALPSQPEYARLKARAIWSIINGDTENLHDGRTTIGRLMRQIVVTLAEGA